MMGIERLELIILIGGSTLIQLSWTMLSIIVRVSSMQLK